MTGFLRIIAVVLAMLILPAGPLFSADRIAKITTIVDYHPFCFKKPNAPDRPNEMIPPGSDSSQIQGYSWDIVRASLHEMGYTIQLTVAPASRCLSNAEEGLTDVTFPASKNKERQKTFLFSRETVNSARYVVYVRADADFAWKGLESLNGKKIAALRRWTYGDKWEANKQIIKEDTESIRQGFDMLDRKRVFGVAGYEAAYDAFLAKEGMTDRYRKLPAFDTNSEYMIGSKSHVPAAAIIDDFDRGKKKITQKGIFDAIVEKWR